MLLLLVFWGEVVLVLFYRLLVFYRIYNTDVLFVLEIHIWYLCVCLIEWNKEIKLVIEQNKDGETGAIAAKEIATQTDSGLVVPVIRHAETLDLWQSANEVKRLSTAARSGKAKREELSGSTITITSLGPLGGIVTTPVINSPEVAIIGINKIAKRPVWQDGGFVPRDIMNISSSFDHRVIDGCEAALFVQRIRSLLESPATLFM